MGGPKMGPFRAPFWAQVGRKGGPFLGPGKVQPGPEMSNIVQTGFLAGPRRPGLRPKNQNVRTIEEYCRRAGSRPGREEIFLIIAHHK